MQPAETPDDNLVKLKQPEAPQAVNPGPDAEASDRVSDGIEAEFMLETSAVCPHCLEDIERIQVVRMLRTKVNFVSSLPRRGQLLVCPKCRIALAGALGGLL